MDVVEVVLVKCVHLTMLEEDKYYIYIISIHSTLHTLTTNEYLIGQFILVNGWLKEDRWETFLAAKYFVVEYMIVSDVSPNSNATNWKITFSK